MSSEDLKKVLDEIKRFQSQAIYARTKELLNNEIVKLEKEINDQQPKIQEVKTNGQQSSTASNRIRVELHDHAFDESDKFVKIHIPFNQCKINEENVNIAFTEDSFNLTITGDNKDYYFTVKSLLKSINVEKSYRKVKEDMVSIYLKKAAEGSKWEVLTKTEKMLKEQKAKMFDDKEKSDDPMGGLMNIMKKMYDSGDPEMKRTIAKAWTEGQNKNNSEMKL